ncbi:MAG: zinc-binding dehydrogenase [Solirubrobacterales bacterium]|nr:zinc-binding dehydrogenase [Solirubrobacterales bacterium]
MKAARITAYGEPPELVEIEPPAEAGPYADSVAGPAEVVEVLIAGINPVDLAIASGKFDAGAPPLPYVPGTEGIGRMADGEIVWFDGSHFPWGSMAERAVITEGGGITLPPGINPEQAIAFGVAGLAAWMSLDWRGELKDGETVLILGASGSVGQIAVQAARMMGAGRVVGMARSEAGRQKVLDLGADAAIGSEGNIDELKASIFEATGGGADLVLDGLWGLPAAATLQTMKPFGRLVQVGNSAGTEAPVTAGHIRGSSASIRGFRNFWPPREVRVEAFQRMCSLAVSGDLEIEVEVLPLEDVAEAWDRQSRSPGHKLALRP